MCYIYIYAAPCQRSATRRSHARQCSLGLGSWRLVDVSVLVWLALGFCAAFWFVILSPRFKRGCGCTAGRGPRPAGRVFWPTSRPARSRPPRAPRSPVRGRTRETQRPRRTPRAKAEPGSEQIKRVATPPHAAYRRTRRKRNRESPETARAFSLAGGAHPRGPQAQAASISFFYRNIYAGEAAAGARGAAGRGAGAGARGPAAPSPAAVLYTNIVLFRALFLQRVML
jgi:hypothetical protein